MPANLTGRVLSLHQHPDKSGEMMRAVELFDVIAGKGIAGNGRYFGRINHSSGQPGKRQVSLMEREQIDEHAATLGLQSIPAGAVRANIGTSGIDLIALIGREVQLGGAVLFFYDARTPCEKMDRICQGLRALMEDRKHGVVGQVTQSGIIRVGNLIRAS